MNNEWLKALDQSKRLMPLREEQKEEKDDSLGEVEARMSWAF